MKHAEFSVLDEPKCGGGFSEEITVVGDDDAHAVEILEHDLDGVF